MQESLSLWTMDGYTISTDKSHLDEDAIFDFLNRTAYWSRGIPRETLRKSIANTALCYGIFKGRPGARQIGFARVITDLATFAYIADVFVLEDHRGLGLAKWLISIIMSNPDLQDIRQLLLATKDAHSLYSQFGFQLLEDPGRFMAIIKPYIKD